MAFATRVRVRERGNFDPGDVALRGPVDAFAAPTVSVQGLTLNTSGAAFFDADGVPITAVDFFAALQVNQVLDVGGAVWTESTRTLSGGAITLLGFEHTQPPPLPNGAIVSGTVSSYGVDTPIFGNGFE